MSSGGRGIIVRIWNNFLSSITTKQSPHREVGRDHFGNKYFEIAADPSRGKRKPRRWFEPRIKDNFSADMPPEWEAWLRTRRVSPPTEEEIARNEAIKKSKQRKGELLERTAREDCERRQGGITSPQLPSDSYSSGPCSCINVLLPRRTTFRVAAQFRAAHRYRRQ
ncbi:NADH dehydrogenase [ubiquinone] 1 alpha subcomplex assembly factor 2 isoform X2 [Dermacentor albipictus]|uniref:NADH dehydrogenase [ubiquinone] 1 alpha subcomplex assembly factor 2 isoform X2 n=1 Tax=Dermacentor albipictus TaxID=60249 RepID=UPI0031FD9598